MRMVPGLRSGPPGGSPERLVAAGGYVMLLVLGVLEGMVGSFQYSRALGSVPVAAVAFALLIGVTCVLGAWGMHRPMGGLLPAVGWFVASFVLAMGTSSGSVLVTSTSAGTWFLYGGAACAIVGVIAGFVFWSPRRLLPSPGTGAWQREIPPGGQRDSGASPPGRARPGRQARISDVPRVRGDVAGGGAPGGGAQGAAEVDARSADSGQSDR